MVKLDRSRQHARLLIMLERVAEALEYGGVGYVISHGTLLGAVRHGGFIPWDDDVDLHVAAEDMVLALTVLEERLPAEFRVMHQRRCGVPWDVDIRVVDQRTRLEGTNSRERMGLYIDLLEMPRIGSWGRAWYGVMKAVRNQSRRLSAGRKCSGPLCMSLRGIGKGAELGAWLSRGFPGAKRRVVNDRLVGGKHPESAIFPAVHLPFESLSLPAPQDYDRVLRDLYGNYQKLPAVNQRKSHYAGVYWDDEGASS
ncbi:MULTISPECIES: LicD family protein [unclassified Thioalkalivibrio]|uniref:LicD family protein n=1 Tax=unclassified Thioalkalivibrio TaxID=2621013 RepID=UPI0009DB88B2|nr:MULTISPECIES: LicD family protein [unclassified Thioalkalivibrio]